MGFAEMVRSGSPGARAGALPARSHVCFVAPHAWPVLAGDARIAEAGGAEVQQSILARLFAAHGHRVSMITLDYGQPDATCVDGVSVHKAFAPRAGLPVLRFLHPRLTSMWRALRRTGADLYYVRSASMWLWLVTEYCRRHGARSIYAGASDKDFEPGIGGQIRYARDRWLYRRGLAAADAIVAQNAFQRASCLKHHGRDAVVIPSCYLPPPFAPCENRELVLWVGMFQDSKRPWLVLELAARLPHRRFVMVGGPRPGGRSLYERVRAQAARMPNVEMTGFLPLAAVEPWFDRARVFVNTSAYEGMPNTFLQAWARGVPTVATVDVGVGAPVYSIFGEPAAGAAEIERLFEDEGHWRARSKACRAHFDREYSPESVVAQYGALFEELAA